MPNATTAIVASIAIGTSHVRQTEGAWGIPSEATQVPGESATSTPTPAPPTSGPASGLARASLADRVAGDRASCRGDPERTQQGFDHQDASGGHTDDEANDHCGRF